MKMDQLGNSSRWCQVAMEESRRMGWSLRGQTEGRSLKGTPLLPAQGSGSFQIMSRPHPCSTRFLERVAPNRQEFRLVSNGSDPHQRISDVDPLPVVTEVFSGTESSLSTSPMLGTVVCCISVLLGLPTVWG